MNIKKSAHFKTEHFPFAINQQNRRDLFCYALSINYVIINLNSKL